MVRLFQTQLEHYERAGNTLSLEGKANQLGQMVRANPPAAMSASWCYSSPASTKRAAGVGCSYDVTGGRYEEIDYQSEGSGSVHANWIKAGWRGAGSRRDDRPRGAGAVRGGRRGRRHRRPRPCARHLTDGRRHRRRSPAVPDDEVVKPQSDPVAGSRAGGVTHEHAVLRLARTGMRTAPTTRGKASPAAAVCSHWSVRRGSSSSPKTRPARCRRSARSTTASGSLRSACTASTNCCASRAYATRTSRAIRIHART
jgi:hypothetical protein